MVIACERVAALFYVSEAAIVDDKIDYPDIETIKLIGNPIDVTFFESSIVVSVLSANLANDADEPEKVTFAIAML